jgi:hypothetical protein
MTGNNLTSASEWEAKTHGKDHLDRCLFMAVPMWVCEHQNKPVEWLMYRKDNIRVPKEYQRHSDEVRSISSLIAERGDTMMYGSKRKGEAGWLFNLLAEGLAILAIVCKGGVDFGSMHFEYPHKDLK